MYRADQDRINYDRNMIAWTQLWALYRVADHYDLDGMHLDISNSSAVHGAMIVD